MLNRSVDRSGLPSMQVFCGRMGERADSFNTPVVGRLSFGAKSGYSESALLAVTHEGTLRNDIYNDCVVGIVRIGSDNSAETPRCPTITLDKLPLCCDGKIALLDPSSQRLFVSPDLQTVERYAKSLRSEPLTRSANKLILPNGKRLRIYERLFEANAVTDTADGFIFELSRRQTDTCSEDTLYELYRDVAEAAIGRTVVVSAELNEELEKNLRAILRSAVYGRFSLLFRGILSNDELKYALELYSKVFCQLETEGREFNGYIQRGLCIDSPLLLEEGSCIDGIDFCTVDTEELVRSMIGGRRNDCDGAHHSTVAAHIKRFFERSPSIRYSAILGDKALSPALCRAFIEINSSLFFISANRRNDLLRILSENLQS